MEPVPIQDIYHPGARRGSSRPAMQHSCQFGSGLLLLLHLGAGIMKDAVFFGQCRGAVVDSPSEKVGCHHRSSVSQLLLPAHLVNAVAAVPDKNGCNNLPI